ncbi:hypothetical protein PACILC2_52790 [Paenibacillus cisolokensis]|uniref:DUF2627 domain-containing protein n=1 Tax=Paenibacillus cisolokensis TaxID=1658519 RepID=A0ABQ4NEW0_9BACL|nr:hypothetical protein PACILC2_52790 [Paenibacillus cisolokensis]
MKMVISRFIAVLLLVIPGIAACYGFLKMKNAVFHYFSQFGNDSIQPAFDWLPFLLGFVLFFLGIGFIGGWIFSATASGIMWPPGFAGKNRVPRVPMLYRESKPQSRRLRFLPERNEKPPIVRMTKTAASY